MKQKDIVTLVVVMAMSAVFGVIVSGIIFKSAAKRDLKVPTVTAINDQLTLPDPKIFNDKALNPTQTITIGDGTNANPFNGQ